jgi:hypothetical protein
MSFRFVAILCGVAMSITLAFNGAFAADPVEAPTSSGQPQASGIAPHADKLLGQACQALASADAFSFHAEIIFDRAFRTGIKVQYAGAMEFAVERPDQLAIKFQSDIGAKELWYSGSTLTIFDGAHNAYATLSVPSLIDGMLEQVADKQNLTIPLSNFAASDMCAVVHKQVTYGAYVGVGDVNGVDCDHLIFSSPKADYQLWLDRAAKPIPRKVVITYRDLPGAPEYMAFLSDWKFPKQIPPSRFRPDLPKDAQHIEFLKVKEE